MSYTMDEAYGKTKKNVNLERELKLDRKNKTFMETAPKKEKRRISLDKVIQDKVITKKSKHFASNHREEVNGKEILDLGRSLSPLRGIPLKVSLAQAILMVENKQNVRWLSKMRAPLRNTSK